MVCTHHVQRYECQPVDGVDTVSEEDEPGLIEATGTLASLEGVESGRDDQEEWEDESSDETSVHSRANQDPNISLKNMFPGGWLKDQP